MFYSKETSGFYHIDIHATMPSDVVEISNDRHRELLDGQSSGKTISVDDNGFPILLDAVEHIPTYQETRRMEYPSMQDQLDMIFHSGLDIWKEQIQSIKDKYPKV
jgi:hypothetical protein